MNEPHHVTFAVSQVSRRPFLGGLGSAAFTGVFLPACGDGSEDPATATAATGTVTSTGTATGGSTPASTAAFPVTIEHKYGATDIASKPERVLSLASNDQNAILVLGVTPITTRYWFGEKPGAWTSDNLAGEPPRSWNGPRRT